MRYESRRHGDPHAHATAAEHWTRQGRRQALPLAQGAAAGQAPKGTILFVHGSSMASQPTFDLQVPGRPDSSVMDWFAARGFDTWCMDNEGYGRSDKTRPINCDIANGADDLAAGTEYILQARGAQEAAGVRHLLRRAEGGAVRRSAIPSASRASRSTPSSGPARAARRSPSARRSCPSSRRRTAARSTARSCTASSRATIPAPPTRRPSRPSPTRSSRSTTRCRPAPTSTCARSCRWSIRRRSPVPTIVMRGEYDGIASFDDLLEFFERLPQLRQAVLA